MKKLGPGIIFVVLILSMTAFSSCKNKKEINTLVDGKLYGDLPEKEMLVWFSRTPCFGTCPHFDFFIFNNLTCNFEGKNFVDSIGLYHSTILPDQFYQVIEIADKIKYFEMQERYDNKNVMDLPATTTIIRNDSVSHKVMNRYQGPVELKELYIALQEIVDNLELVKH